MTIYKEFLPTPSLREYVHCIWVFNEEQPGPPDVIVPDGRPELIIHLGTPYIETQTGQSQSKLLFAGQLTKPLEIVSNGNAFVWGVRFRPDGAGPFLKQSVERTTDLRTDMSEPLAHLLSALQNAHDMADQLGVITRNIADIISAEPVDPMVRGIVDSILSDSPLIIPEHLTARQVQRRFKRATGISLRTFKSIRRFRSVFDRLQQNEDETWVERALASEYFDQPQLARGFQRFLGCSARHWLETNAGLGKALSAAPG